MKRKLLFYLFVSLAYLLWTGGTAIWAMSSKHPDSERTWLILQQWAWPTIFIATLYLAHHFVKSFWHAIVPLAISASIVLLTIAAIVDGGCPPRPERVLHTEKAPTDFLLSPSEETFEQECPFYINLQENNPRILIPGGYRLLPDRVARSLVAQPWNELYIDTLAPNNQRFKFTEVRIVVSSSEDECTGDPLQVFSSEREAIVFVQRIKRIASTLTTRS